MSATSTPAASSKLPRGLMVLIGIAAVVVSFMGMQLLAGILGPLFLALMLVIAVTPVQRWLTRSGVPRPLATVLILLLLYSILLGLGTVFVVSIARLATILPQYSDQAQQLINSVQEQLEQLGIGQAQATAIIERIDPNQLINVFSGLMSGLVDVLSNLVFLFLLIFFLGLDSAKFPERLAALTRFRPSVANALSSFVHGTRRYLAVSTIFGVICASLDVVALSWIGVPLPVLWGLLAFITNYIPNIGFFIGLVPPALLGLLVGGLRELVLVVVAYAAINFVIQSLIQPKFLGDSVGLTVTMTFVGLTFWAWVLGALGALLAIPLTMLAKAFLVDIDPTTRWMNLFLESRPAGLPSGRRHR